MPTPAAVRPVSPSEPAHRKRKAILAAAAEVFLSVGYGRASMNAIARQAGVAKQTLYAHFGSKAALFGATMTERCDWLLEPLPRRNDGDPAAALDAMARRFLDIILAPEAVARLRVVMAEQERFPELAQVFYAAGPGRATAGLAEYLARMDREGVLHVADPQLAASQFFGMIRGDVFFRRVLGLAGVPDSGVIDDVVRGAVRTFMAAHRRRTGLPPPAEPARRWKPETNSP